jgi:hypothetical protein
MLRIGWVIPRGKVTLWCCDSWPDGVVHGGEMSAQPTRDMHSPHEAVVYTLHMSSAWVSISEASNHTAVYQPPHQTLQTPAADTA